MQSSCHQWELKKEKSIAAVFLDPSEDKLLTNIISDSCGAYGIHGRWCYFHLYLLCSPVSTFMVCQSLCFRVS